MREVDEVLDELFVAFFLLAGISVCVSVLSCSVADRFAGVLVLFRSSVVLTMSLAFLTRVISISLLVVGVARFVYLFSGNDVGSVVGCVLSSLGLSHESSGRLNFSIVSTFPRIVDDISGGISKRLLLALPGASVSH